MKKRKLLIPLAAIAAFGTVSTSLVTLASCGDPDVPPVVNELYKIEGTKLVGLNTELTQEQINEKLAGKDTLPIPEGITEIGDGAFEVKTGALKISDNITKLDLTGITKIGDDAFSGNSQIANVKLVEGLTSIGAEAFEATAISEIIIPKTVQTIGSSAFLYCENLALIDVSNLTIVPTETAWGGTTTFMGIAETGVVKYSTITTKTAWSGLFYEISSGTIDESGGKWSFEPITANLFDVVGGVLKGFNTAYTQEQIKQQLVGTDKLEIPADVTSVAEGAFDHSISSKLYIPESIKIIDLSKATSITSIGANAFKATSTLETIVIPKTVATIGAGAFADCGKLKTIDLSTFDSFPKGWDANAFNKIHSVKGTIKVNATKVNEVVKPAIEYFGKGDQFLLFDTAFDSSDLWKFNRPFTAAELGITAENAFAIDANSTLTGFNPGFGVLEDSAKKQLLYKNGTLVIPKAVKAIADYAFHKTGYGVEGKDEATILPDGVDMIAFAKGSECTSIGAYAFAYTQLTGLDFSHAAISEVGEYAFAYNDYFTYDDDSYFDFFGCKEGPEGWSKTAFYYIGEKGGNAMFTYIYDYEEAYEDWAGYLDEASDGFLQDYSTIYISGKEPSVKLADGGEIPDKILVGSEPFNIAAFDEDGDEIADATFSTTSTSIKLEGNKVTPLAAGNATITCSVPGYDETTADLSIVEAMEIKTATGEKMPESINVNQELGLAAYDKDGVVTGATFTAYSPSGAITIVDKTKVKGLKEGTGTITCKAPGHADATYEITVVPAPAKELFEINSGVLSGFNEDLTQAEVDEMLDGETTLLIPAEVTSIADDAFAYTEVANALNVPENITAIDFEAESQCASIGASAFSLIPSIESVTLPSSITSIGEYALSYCENLVSIDVSAFTTVPTAIEEWEYGVFEGVGTEGTVYISSDTDYRDWDSLFGDIGAGCSSYSDWEYQTK